MAGVRRIGLVLCPDFDFMGLAVTSPFAVANRYVADTTYDIHVLSEAGGLLRSGCGPAVETEPLGEPSDFDTIIVAAGISLPEPSAASKKADYCRPTPSPTAFPDQMLATPVRR